jgi:hypothetical protein
MLHDQRIAEISASSGTYRDYLRFTRPAAARQMRAFGLEFEFSAAERDGLRLAQLAVDDFGRHHTCPFAEDDPVRQIEPAFASATGPWLPATR